MRPSGRRSPGFSRDDGHGFFSMRVSVRSPESARARLLGAGHAMRRALAADDHDNELVPPRPDVLEYWCGRPCTSRRSCARHRGQQPPRLAVDDSRLARRDRRRGVPRLGVGAQRGHRARLRRRPRIPPARRRHAGDPRRARPRPGRERGRRNALQHLGRPGPSPGPVATHDVGVLRLRRPHHREWRPRRARRRARGRHPLGDAPRHRRALPRARQAPDLGRGAGARRGAARRASCPRHPVRGGLRRRHDRGARPGHRSLRGRGGRGLPPAGVARLPDVGRCRWQRGSRLGRLRRGVPVAGGLPPAGPSSAPRPADRGGGGAPDDPAGRDRREGLPRRLGPHVAHGHALGGGRARLAPARRRRRPLRRGGGQGRAGLGRDGRARRRHPARRARVGVRGGRCRVAHRRAARALPGGRERPPRRDAPGRAPRRLSRRRPDHDRPVLPHAVVRPDRCRLDAPSPGPHRPRRRREPPRGAHASRLRERRVGPPRDRPHRRRRPARPLDARRPRRRSRRRSRSRRKRHRRRRQHGAAPRPRPADREHPGGPLAGHRLPVDLRGGLDDAGVPRRGPSHRGRRDHRHVRTAAGSRPL